MITTYTYTHSIPLLTAFFSVGANSTGSINSNLLTADVAVLIGSDLEWYPGFSTLVSEVANGFIEGGRDSLFITNGSNINTTGSFSFMLNPGDEFYVIGSVGARSINGFEDGWNTLTLGFTDDTGLTAVSADRFRPLYSYLFLVWLA